MSLALERITAQNHGPRRPQTDSVRSADGPSPETAAPERWNHAIDLVVREPTCELSDQTVIARKLLHTSQIVAVLPFMALSQRTLALALAGACAFVVTTQRRGPWASLGLLTLLACAQRPALGGGWVVLTAGDGLAGIAGRLLAGPRLPWNRRKTWSGSVTFVLAAGAALYAFLRRWQPGAGRQRSLAIAALTALAGAGVETLPIPLDDNYTVPVVAGLLVEALLQRTFAHKETQTTVTVHVREHSD